MTDESRRPNIKPEGGVGPLVCPRGHHSVALRTNRFTCRTCENQGREKFSWHRSALVDLRDEEPPLRNEGNVATDGGTDTNGTDHWKEQDECQECGADDVQLRAIKLSSGERDLLCIECFIEALDEDRVHPDDPRVNDDGTPDLGTPAAPGQRGGRDA